MSTVTAPTPYTLPPSVGSIGELDGYKVDHRRQYPPGTEFVYSNFTPRSSRVLGQDHVFFIGLQMFLAEFLTDEFDRSFFSRPADEITEAYARRINAYLGPNEVGTDHIRELHDLGYLPLSFRALPEGSLVPIGIPLFTVVNTDKRFFWLVNYIETVMSAYMWLSITSATTASRFRRILEVWAEKTGSPPEFVDWQGHDFSFRGMQGPEAAARSGLAHLLFFTGTDTIPAIELAEQVYGPIADDYLVGGSVAATEHSVMCAGGMKDELATFERLLDLYPTGILSVVSDTWDLWNVCINIVPELKDKILARDGKLVIRPDSGDPVKIVVGDPDAAPGTPEHKGVVELLWEVFGGTTTSTGHRVLDPHIGVIYGDGINEERMDAILSGLARKGFASANMVFGLGSFTYTYVTRDTYGMAMKATWCMIDGVAYDMHKDPVTDDGGKRSARGKLAVVTGPDGWPALRQQVSPAEEEGGLLREVWRDGKFLVHESFDVVRARAREQFAEWYAA